MSKTSLTRLCSLIAALVSGTLVQGADPVVHYSPDRSAFAAWTDADAGRPVGVIRSIVFRLTSDQGLYFSRVTTPRNTQAAWNAGSTRCALSDAPDNGNVDIWILEHHREEPLWRPVAIQPLASIQQAFQPSDHGPSLWRPSVLKMAWTDDSTLVLRCYCNLGTYLITVDARQPAAEPKVQRLSEKLAEE